MNHELAARMVEHVRSDLLVQLPELAERLRVPTKERFAASVEEVVDILSAPAEAPCVAIISRQGDCFSLWMWLPGLPHFDIFVYRFDANGDDTQGRARVIRRALLEP